MNHTDFCKSFFFTEYRYGRTHYTDARSGANLHFLALLEEGHCRIVSEDRVIEAGPGQPFYIPMGLPYQSYWFSDTTVRFRSCGFALFPEMAEAAFRLQVLPEEFANEVRRIPLTGRPDSAALGELFRVLGKVLPCVERQTPSSVCLWQQAMDYMRAHRDCRVTEVARACGVSESAIYAAFRRHNSTPNAARQQLLVEEAVRLLTTTDSSVQEISDGLGFSSSAYFRKVLHQHTGKTPTQIRKTAEKV